MDEIVQIKDLYKHFGSVRAVDGLNLSVKGGEIYGLLGPNGSGKTTLIRLILGLLKPSSGDISVLGQTMPDKSILSQVGYMTQSSALYDDLSVWENVAFFSEICGSMSRKQVDEAVTLVGLQDKKDALIRTLSGGMKQRTSLACALAHQPKLLLLDEPTVGIDPQLRATFWTYFRQLASKGVTLIISSHVMDEAERCNRLGFLRQGKLLAEGSADALREKAETTTLEEAFLHFVEEPLAGED